LFHNNKYKVSHKYSCFSWWWTHSRPKHVEKRNKHTKKNCAQIWFYLQDLFCCFKVRRIASNRIMISRKTWKRNLPPKNLNTCILKYCQSQLSPHKPCQTFVTPNYYSEIRHRQQNLVHPYRKIFMSNILSLFFSKE